MDSDRRGGVGGAARCGRRSACVAIKRTLFPFDRVRIASLFNREPPPDVVLVTNRLRGSGASRAACGQGHDAKQQHQEFRVPEVVFEQPGEEHGD